MSECQNLGRPVGKAKRKNQGVLLNTCKVRKTFYPMRLSWLCIRVFKFRWDEFPRNFVYWSSNLMQPNVINRSKLLFLLSYKLPEKYVINFVFVVAQLLWKWHVLKAKPWLTVRRYEYGDQIGWDSNFPLTGVRYLWYNQ